MNNLVSCPMCQKKFKSLMSHLRIIHRVTPTELLKQYPNTKMVSDSVKSKASNSCVKSGCGRIPGFHVSEEQKSKISNSLLGEKNHFYGKRHSQKTRRQMSRNHADFRGTRNPLVKWLAQNEKNREVYSRRCKEKWKDPQNYEMLCQSNRKSIIKAMLNGNHHPYSKCKHGWFVSKKFSSKFYYQSSWEKRFLEFCEISQKIISLQRLPFVIPYMGKDGKPHTYYADFFVNGKIIIELKPSSMLNYNNNQQKIIAGKEYCKTNGYEYKLLTETELNNLDNIL